MLWFGCLSGISQLASRVWGWERGSKTIALHIITLPGLGIARAGEGVALPPLTRLHPPHVYSTSLQDLVKI